MNSKPSSRDGYDVEQLDRVRQTCIHMATKLGDLLDEIVVIGGLVPYLLIDQENLPSGLEPHAGTMDLDMGLVLAILNRERYRELGIRLRDAGFQPDVNDQGNRRFQSWTTGGAHPVEVDFLIPHTDEMDKGNRILHIECDLAAIVTPGLELAFQDRCRKELSGTTPSGAWATRNIPVCGPGAFTVLKALAFHNRTANKDAYDLFYVWSGIGIPKVAEHLAVLLPNPYIDDALSVIETDFCNHDGLGPITTARFITQGLDDDVQADVVGLAQELLRSMGQL
ncbi:MAG: hypothetical protein F4Y80_15350 [Caldilineaceae bacterium SB0665_bin_21]|nr:hypothetical protein [Caldilineaceae bacterium SB0665_bin_21]